MSLSIVIFPADPGLEGYVGACVEKHIVTQGSTLEDVHYQMESAFAVHAALDAENGVDTFANIPDAPREFRKAFMGAERELEFGCLDFHSGCANDTEATDSAKSVRGARYYRFTEVRPPTEPLPWWL